MTIILISGFIWNECNKIVIVKLTNSNTKYNVL